jgi:uncharacterized protein (TIGR00251 family)
MSYRSCSIMPKAYSSLHKPQVTLKIRLQPRAAREGIDGMHGDSIKIRVTAPALEGKANTALTRLIAKKLKIAASNIEIIAGLHSREKLLRISGITPAALEKAFGITLPPG